MGGNRVEQASCFAAAADATDKLLNASSIFIAILNAGIYGRLMLGGFGTDCAPCIVAVRDTVGAILNVLAYVLDLSRELCADTEPSWFAVPAGSPSSEVLDACI